MSLTHVRLNLSDPHGPAGETFWADDLGDNRARLDNIPFFTDLFTLGSVVVVNDNNDVVGVESHKFAGNSIIALQENASEDGVTNLYETLTAIGVELERATASAFVAAVPASAEIAFYRLIKTADVSVVESWSYQNLPPAPFSV